MKNSKRILPNGKRKGVKFARITHEQVAEALLVFKVKGGLIKQLPPQPELQRSEVGNHWDTMYEPVFDLL